jgi:hypothetical protein
MAIVSPAALFDARPTALGWRAWWRGRRTVDEIVSGLYIGGFPARSGPIPAILADLGISHVVTTTFAVPDPIAGTTSRHVPFLDAGIPALEPIVAAAVDSARRIERGGRVYVHCGHGLDRCALLAAFIVRELEPGLGGPAIVRLIRTRRGPEALHNRRFARLVGDLAPVQGPARHRPTHPPTLMPGERASLLGAAATAPRSPAAMLSNPAMMTGPE